MTTILSIDAVKACEDIIREHHEQNAEANIWPSANRVAEALLSRPVEMRCVYEEAHKQLNGEYWSLWKFIELILTTPAIWSPDDIAQAREAKARLKEVNDEIFHLGKRLTALLGERDNLHNTTGFHSDTQYHVTKVIEQAADEHGLFSMYVKDKLRLLRRQYDLKYWPSLAQFVDVIADDAADNSDLRTDPVTQAATGSRRKSRADFVRAMLAAFAEACDIYDGWLPQLKLTDKSIATIVNCCLNFDADDGIDAEYVKGVRARDKRNAL